MNLKLPSRTLDFSWPLREGPGCGIQKEKPHACRNHRGERKGYYPKIGSPSIFSYMLVPRAPQCRVNFARVKNTHTP